MNVTVEIKAPELVQALNNLAEAISNGSTQKASAGAQAKPVKGKQLEMPVQETPEVIEEVEEKTKVDVSSIKKEIKMLAVKLVKAKKRDDLILLNEKYGVDAASKVADEDVANYLEDLKALDD